MIVILTFSSFANVLVKEFAVRIPENDAPTITMFVVVIGKGSRPRFHFRAVSAVIWYNELYQTFTCKLNPMFIELIKSPLH
jgi:hypothetical protein